jgi:hypothetical protein
MSSLMCVRITRFAPMIGSLSRSVESDRCARTTIVERVALTDEEVGAARGLDQRVCPLGVAGVADDLSLELDAVGEARPGVVVVTNVERGNSKRADHVSRSDLHFPQRQLERQLANWPVGANPLNDD